MTYLLLEYYVCLKGHNRSKNVTRKDKNGGKKNMGGTASILEMSKLFRLERKNKMVDIFSH